MLSHGDEIGRTQQGNNNTYCQDNTITWVSWKLDARQRALLEFTRKVFAVRAENPVLRRRTFFSGQVEEHRGLKDLTWLRPDGAEMAKDDWHNADAHALGMLIDGDATDETDETGTPIKGETMLLLVNASEANVDFRMPAGKWSTVIDTDDRPDPAGEHYTLTPFSLVLLRLTP
jgi:glycogen operon protein